MKKAGITFIILSCPLAAAAQAKYLDGYAIKVNDTIYCKVLFDPNTFIKTSVTLLIDDSPFEYNAGGPVWSYGIRHDNGVTHYGTVSWYNGNRRRNIFIKKIVTGKVELYQHIYTLIRTTRGTGNNITEHHEDYYIARTNDPDLSTPRLLRDLRWKLIEKYIYDFPALEKSKKLNIQGLIQLLKEYNSKH
jgi:hypothetical protein